MAGHLQRISTPHRPLLRLHCGAVPRPVHLLHFCHPRHLRGCEGQRSTRQVGQDRVRLRSISTQTDNGAQANTRCHVLQILARVAQLPLLFALATKNSVLGLLGKTYERVSGAWQITMMRTDKLPEILTWPTLSVETRCSLTSSIASLADAYFFAVSFTLRGI